MTRTIVLPQNIAGKLYRLTSKVEEVDGLLFYRKRAEFCPLESVFITGVGTEGHVQPERERIAIANEFFQQNPEYNVVRFHTYTRGTIARFGNYYAEHFSSQDLKLFQQELRKDGEYLHLLTTPSKFLVYGGNSPRLEIVNSFPGYQQRKKAVNWSLKRIAEKLSR